MLGIAHSWNSITMEERGEFDLLLSSDGRSVVVNRRFRTVKSGATVLIGFDEIKSIDVTYHRRNRGRPEYWSVGLNRNWYSSVRIGRTLDKTEASIVGARLSTYTGKKVRSL